MPALLPSGLYVALPPIRTATTERGVEGLATLTPPPIHYPPLPLPTRCDPPAPSPQRPLVKSAPPFAGWAPHKGFRYPYGKGPTLSAAAAPISIILKWGAGVVDDLPSQLKSELGLDEFNYQIRLRMPPCAVQVQELKEFVVVWAYSAPESLLTCLFHETVDTVIGHHFPWAVFGKAKTYSKTKRLPWR